MTAGRSASVHARLLNASKARGEEFNQLLNRFAAERWLYRLSVTPGRDRLWLKGALLFGIWFETPQRPTRDVDLLDVGPPDEAELVEMVRATCSVDVDDGMTFDASDIRVEAIREQARYGGLRLRLNGLLGRARCPLQIDVGFGDAVTPGPRDVEYPTLLDDLPAPHLKVYPRATVVAEKVEAIASLGIANSRMKDYYDLDVLAREAAVEPALLSAAFRATFGRRGTPLPAEPLSGLADEFATDRTKREQWRAFLEKNGLVAEDLATVVARIREFVDGALRTASRPPR